MSKKLAELTVRLAIDAKFLREWNKGINERERNEVRIAIMNDYGLSEKEQKAVLEHDNEYINKALNQGVPMKLGSWTNSVNSVVRVNTL